MVRKRAGKQDSDRIRADGVPRHGESLRRGPAGDCAHAATGWCSSSSRTEAGNPTRNSSTKARRIASTRMCCALLRTSLGRSRSADYKGEAIEKATAVCREASRRARWMRTRSPSLQTSRLKTERTRNSRAGRCRLLRDAATEKGDLAWWTAEETSVYATGDSAAVETTGLAVQAFLKAGGYSDVVRKSLAWIASKKSGDGNWGTTQATIMALRALLRASEQSGSDARGTAEVLLDGTKVASLEINKENNDLFHQFVLPQTERGSATTRLRFVFRARADWPTRSPGATLFPGSIATAHRAAGNRSEV